MGQLAIRTSDRQLFRRCRRQWHWRSGIRNNLSPKEPKPYFWFGTGGHFALQDYYGERKYGTLEGAFNAYVDAQIRFSADTGYIIPANYEEYRFLGKNIFKHYEEFHNEDRRHYKTHVDKGEAQIEVKCSAELDIEPPAGFDKVLYEATLDRVVDIDGELYVVDYKFVKQFMSQESFDFNPQATAYLWLAGLVYGRPINNMIFYQILKDYPREPDVLKNGKISINKNQKTTYDIYRDALIRKYSTLENVPSENTGCLEYLLMQENADEDKFIRRTHVYRSDAEIQHEYVKIKMECEDMLRKDLALYPNLTKDCYWDCPFNDICLMADRGQDFEDELILTTVNASLIPQESWREYLV